MSVEIEFYEHKPPRNWFDRLTDWYSLGSPLRPSVRSRLCYWISGRLPALVQYHCALRVRNYGQTFEEIIKQNVHSQVAEDGLYRWRAERCYPWPLHKRFGSSHACDTDETCPYFKRIDQPETKTVE